MPDLSTVHDDIQASGYDFDGYLNTPPREVVLAGEVAGVAFEPLHTIFFTTTSGDYLDVQTHMEVEVFSSSGVSKGRLRVASGQTITANAIPVNETSAGRMKVVIGDTFAVYREWRLRDLLVGATLFFPKDSRISHTDENALVAPLPLSGGHWAGKCDLGENYATVPFFGTLSRVMDSDSSGDREYLWDTKDGTIVTGDATTGDIVVQFPPGKRWIDFTVTDVDNGKSTTQHICIVVEDDDHPSIPCSMEELGGARVEGWRMRFGVPLAMYAAIALLPDGQFIIYHEDEWRASGLASYGNPIAGRSRIKFAGFLIAESVEIDAARGVITFEAVSPLALLSLLPGFSQALIEASTPVDWQHYRGLTVLRAIVYLIVWGTTLPVLFDFDVAWLKDRPFAELFIQQNTPYLQLMELFEGLSSELICDRSGRFFASRRLNRADSTTRDNADTLLVLASADVVEMRITRAHRYRSAQMQGNGFTQGTNGQPVLSLAPGEAPAEAPDFTSVDRLIVQDQAELNDVTGWAYAEENSLYDGVTVPASVEIDLRGGYDVGDFYPQWVQLDEALTTELALLWRALNREQVPNDIRLQINAIAVTLGDGGKRITWTCAHETTGATGKTLLPDPEPDDEWDDPIIEFPLPDLTPSPRRIFPWTGQIPVSGVVFSRAEPKVKKAVSFDPLTGIISFVDISTGLAEAGVGYCIWAYSSKWHYRTMYLLTDVGFFKCDDIETFSGWELVYDNASLFGGAHVGHYCADSPFQNGWHCVLAGENALVVTSDNWATKTMLTVDGAAARWSGIPWSLDIIRESGHLLGVSRDASTPSHHNLFHTINGGLSWSGYTDIGYIQAQGNNDYVRIAVPYTRPGGAPNMDDGNLVIGVPVSTVFGAEGFVAIYQGSTLLVKVGSTHFSGNYAYPDDAAHLDQPNAQWSSDPRALTFFTHDASYAFYMCRTLGGGVNDNALVRHTEDLFETRNLSSPFGNGTVNQVNANGWSMNPNVGICWGHGTNGFLKMTLDGGLTWFGSVPDDWAGYPFAQIAYAEFSLYPFQ